MVPSPETTDASPGRGGVEGVTEKESVQTTQSRPACADLLLFLFYSAGGYPPTGNHLTGAIPVVEHFYFVSFRLFPGPRARISVVGTNGTKSLPAVSLSFFSSISLFSFRSSCLSFPDCCSFSWLAYTLVLHFCRFLDFPQRVLPLL